MSGVPTRDWHPCCRSVAVGSHEDRKPVRPTPAVSARLSPWALLPWLSLAAGLGLASPHAAFGQVLRTARSQGQFVPGPVLSSTAICRQEAGDTRLSPARSLRVVSAQDDSPVAGADVWWLGSVGPTHREPRSWFDSAGDWSRHRLEERARSEGTHARTGANGVVEINSAEAPVFMVAAHKGLRARRFYWAFENPLPDLEMVPDDELLVRVTDETGRPIPGAPVSLVHSYGSRESRIRVALDFARTGLDGGTTLADASILKHEYSNSPWRMLAEVASKSRSTTSSSIISKACSKLTAWGSLKD